MPSTARALSTGVAPALTEVVKRVREVRFPLKTPDAASGQDLRRTLDEQLSNYLLPRATDTSAPLLVVVGGSTGAGKSTLVNSIIGHQVSIPGVLRPTTRWPVLVHHPKDREHFASARILPTLERSTSETGAANADLPKLQLIADETIPPGLALLDSPDIDSVDAENRQLARQLLDAADLWLFVTTAARYADALPWELLRQSAGRGTTVAMVLDRVPPQANREVRHHLSGLLSEAGLGAAPIFTIPELALIDGLLPDAAVFPVQSWILNLGRNSRARQRVISRTLVGAVGSVPAKVRTLADHVSTQEEAHRRLAGGLDDEFRDSRDELSAALTDGRVLRGEVLARWQDFVGTGQFFRGIEPSVARIRDRVTSAVTGRRDTAEPLVHAIENSVALLIREQAVAAVHDTTVRWQAVPEGRWLLEEDPTTSALPPSFDQQVAEVVAAWTADVQAMVKEVGQSKGAKARVLSFGVTGVSAVLLLAICAESTRMGTSTNASAGTASVAGKLLSSIFGAGATHELAEAGRTKLISSATAMLDRCRQPFDRALGGTAVPPRQAGVLRSAGERLQEAM